jgi:glycosyltransferase involved in cell wall biosynthesis
VNKPTVLHVLPTFDTGGLGSLALTMLDAWPEPATHLAIAPKYTKTQPTLFPVFAAKCGQGNVLQVNRHAWVQPPVWVDALAKGLASIQRGRVPQNVIVYNFIDSVWSSQAVRLAGFKGTVTAHVGTVLPKNDVTTGTATSKFGWATRFVPASKAVSAALHALGTQPERIHPVVWNGMDLAKYSDDKPTLLGFGSLVFGFCGRMPPEHVKDWKLLFEAFKLANIPGAELRIAGDGPMRGQLEQMAGDPRIKFLGNLDQEQMVDFLLGVDVFVMAALPIEGFSMALVEAVGAGCMILGTDVPSVREVFEAGGEPQYLTKTAKDMASAMRAFVEDDDFGTASAWRRDNFQMVLRLQKRMDAKEMAKAYWSIR